MIRSHLPTGRMPLTQFRQQALLASARRAARDSARARSRPGTMRGTGGPTTGMMAWGVDS